jgi:hypothetical protein
MTTIELNDRLASNPREARELDLRRARERLSSSAVGRHVLAGQIDRVHDRRAALRGLLELVRVHAHLFDQAEHATKASAQLKAAFGGMLDGAETASRPDVVALRN